MASCILSIKLYLKHEDGSWSEIEASPLEASERGTTYSYDNISVDFDGQPERQVTSYVGDAGSGVRATLDNRDGFGTAAYLSYSGGAEGYTPEAQTVDGTFSITTFREELYENLDINEDGQGDTATIVIANTMSGPADPDDETGITDMSERDVQIQAEITPIY